jgi:hypothetical protein
MLPQDMGDRRATGPRSGVKFCSSLRMIALMASQQIQPEPRETSIPILKGCF